MPNNPLSDSEVIAIRYALPDTTPEQREKIYEAVASIKAMAVEEERQRIRDLVIELQSAEKDTHAFAQLAKIYNALEEHIKEE